jgi:hypothetical protein
MCTNVNTAGYIKPNMCAQNRNSIRFPDVIHNHNEQSDIPETHVVGFNSFLL